MFDNDLLLGALVLSSTRRCDTERIELTMEQDQIDLLQNVLEEQTKANKLEKQRLAREEEALKTEKEQQYYRNKSFHLLRKVERLKSIDDNMVLCYVLKKYEQAYNEEIIACSNHLNAIDDKVFCKQALDKLATVSQVGNSLTAQYNESLFFHLDEQLQDFEDLQRQISFYKPTPIKQKTIKIKKHKNPLRIIELVLMMLIFLVSLILMTIIFAGEYKLFFSFLGLAILSGVGFVYYLKKEMNFRENYAQYVIDQQQKITMEEKRIAFLKKKNEEAETFNKTALINHPALDTLDKIQEQHPTFKVIINQLKDLENKVIEM